MGSTNMTILASYIYRFWRRKATIIGVVIGLAVFVVCFQLSLGSSSTSSWRGRGGDAKAAPSHPVSGKRLHQAELGEQDDQYAFDQQRGVNFIPGLPSPEKVHGLPDPQPPVYANEVEYYRNKNRALYEAKALEIKAKKSKGYSGFVEERGDLQPAVADDNLEYNDAGGARSVDDGLRPPPPPGNLYRSDSKVGSRWQDQQSGEDEEEERPPYVPERRLIHFDLKGAPPKPEYLIKVLKLAKSLGATGVLMEYEDMFPFDGPLKEVAAANHYSKEEVKAILAACKEMDLEVIPLVQTFGHLELVLKLPSFAHLRDVPEMPESLCPCRPDAVMVAKELVRQVMALHPDARFVHIGCDEVFHLGECQECQAHSRHEVFVSHVSTMAKYVKDVHKAVPLIWDDMLRNMMPAELQPLAGLVEPMVWVYAEDIYRFVPSFTWDRLAEVFPTVWTASAFKGAHGPTLAVPNAKRHLDNNLNWLDLMGAEEHKFQKGFRGMVITGWQRYDHFAVLCELLPSGIPSMALDVIASANGYYNSSLQADLLKGLECVGSTPNLQLPINLDVDPFLFEKMSWCYFPGAPVFKMVQSYMSIQKDVASYLTKARTDQAWLTEYSIRRNYTSPFRIDEGLEEWGMHFNSLTALVRQAKTSLSEVFDDFTVAEWVEQKIWPMLESMNRLKEEAAAARQRKTWPRRPLQPMEELAMFGIKASTTAAPVQQPLVQEKKKPSRHKVVPVQRKASPSLPSKNKGVVVQLPRDRPASSSTQRPKRLVQAPDYYRHPPGSW